MPDPYHFLAALAPSSLLPAACGITCVLLMPTSVVAVLVAGVLCPFRKPLRQALRLSKLAQRAGFIACAAITLGTACTYGYPTEPPQVLGDAVILLLLTAIAPTVAFFIRRFCLQRLELLDAVAQAANAAQSAAETPGADAQTERSPDSSNH